MLFLITGKPGVGKTNLTLTEFLKIQDRPLYACEINDFDYDANNVIKLDHFKDWVNMPDQAVLFVDECQNYLRASAKASDLPKWVTDLETHRHRGIDIYITTQHPAFIHIHFRRLTEHHTHYHRFGGLPIIQKREWSYCADDPNDKSLVNSPDCTRTTVRLNKETFKKYKSTVLDTHKMRIPAKLISYGIAILCLIGFAVYLGYPILSKYMGYASNVDKIGSHDTTSNNTTSSNINIPSPTNNNILPSSHLDHKLSIDDFTPVTPVMPWSAPYYQNIASPTDFPRFAGCMQVAKSCKCYTQQGTLLTVDTDICHSVITGDSMPFNPFKRDSSPSTQLPATASSSESTPRLHPSESSHDDIS